MLAAVVYFQKVISDVVGKVFFFKRKSGVTGNCVHRRSQIVAHVGEKRAFCTAVLLSQNAFSLNDLFALFYDRENAEYHGNGTENKNCLNKNIQPDVFAKGHNALGDIVSGFYYIVVVGTESGFNRLFFLHGANVLCDIRGFTGSCLENPYYRQKQNKEQKNNPNYFAFSKPPCLVTFDQQAENNHSEQAPYDKNQKRFRCERAFLRPQRRQQIEANKYK